MPVREIKSTERTTWDNFVVHASQGNPFHLTGWVDVYSRTYGLPAFLLASFDRGEIVGTLPLLHVKSPLMGNYLTSMPGGLISSNKDAAQELLEVSRILADKMGVRFIALRDSYSEYKDSELILSNEHCTMEIDLRSGLDSVLKNINRPTKQYAKRAKRNGIHLEIGNEHLDDFYKVYQSAMRQKGTPTQGKRFFINALSTFPDRYMLTVVKDDNQIFGGGFVFHIKDRLICTFAGLDRRYYDIFSSYAFYWDSILYAIEQDKSYLDLGRSRVGSGTYDFKGKWGAVPRMIYQQYHLFKGDSLPQLGGTHDKKRVTRSFFSSWRKLPLPITELIGPQLRKQVPFG